MAVKKLKDPFKKTRKTATSASKKPEIETPFEVCQAITEFKEIKEEISGLEGQLTGIKGTIMAFGKDEFVRQCSNGNFSGFKLLGNDCHVSYVAQDRSKGMSDEQVETIAEVYGDDVAGNIIVEDLASLKFNTAVLEANYDAVVKALQTLPAAVMENLFKPMTQKAVPVRLLYKETGEKFRDALDDLGMTHYVK